jgi:hypothetical protein
MFLVCELFRNSDRVQGKQKTSALCLSKTWKRKQVKHGIKLTFVPHFDFVGFSELKRRKF